MIIETKHGFLGYNNFNSFKDLECFMRLEKVDEIDIIDITLTGHSFKFPFNGLTYQNVLEILESR